MVSTKRLKEALRTKRKKEPETIHPRDMVSSGSTLLNLACSGKPGGAFAKGKYYFFVGDSSSGKTWLTLTCLAEAARKKSFDDYRFIYDNVEDGALMDIEFYFGSEVAKRLEAPAGTEDEPIYSETIEDFYFNLTDALENDQPCIYILDSMDALSSLYEGKKFKERRDTRKKGTTAKGDYGDGKAKINSGSIRKIVSMLRRTKSILIVINQTRDNINAGLFESKKTRSGGRSLTFYACLEIWTSIARKIKKKVNDRDRQIGVVARAGIKKNRITGRDRTVEIPIYQTFGIDDIGSIVDWLVLEKYWKKVSGGLLVARDFDVKLRRDALIRHIEEEDLERELQFIAAKCWRDIEAKLDPNRKRRYT